MSLDEETLKLKTEIEVLRSEVKVLHEQKTAAETQVVILTLENQDLHAKNADQSKQIDELAHVSEDSASITLELADWLKHTKSIRGYGDCLIRFDVAAKEINRKPKDISVNFKAACEKADLEIVEQREALATVRRRSRQAFQ